LIKVTTTDPCLGRPSAVLNRVVDGRLWRATSTADRALKRRKLKPLLLTL
jgi:hypothetical protein